MDESRLRFEFERRKVTPEFHVEVEWVEPDWPLSTVVEWQDEAAPGDYYYVRVEQMDANYAWSSPIWIV